MAQKPRSVILIAIGCAASGRADAGVLDRLRQDKTLRIAYRTGARIRF